MGARSSSSIANDMRRSECSQWQSTLDLIEEALSLLEDDDLILRRDGDDDENTSGDGSFTMN
jgi:hypothetical protein